MIKRGLLLILSVAFLTGCATLGAGTTPTFTLKNGHTVKAAKILQETSSTYVIEEAGTGRRTVIPKHLVTSVKGKR